MAKFLKDISQPTFHNLVFISVVFFSIWAFLLLRFNPQAQFFLIIAVAVFYLAWAVTYHLWRKDLSLKILTEYLLYSVIAAVVGFIIFLGR